MYGGDYLGSDALSPDAAEAYEFEYDAVLIQLEKAASEAQAAREFLNTTLGQAIRKTLFQSKLTAMRDLANHAMDADFMNYKHHYDVICGVESVFAQIIVEGEQALNQLNTMVTENE